MTIVTLLGTSCDKAGVVVEIALHNCIIVRAVRSLAYIKVKQLYKCLCTTQVLSVYYPIEEMDALNRIIGS